MLASVLAMAMVFIDTTALNVALPAIQSSLEATGAELFWFISAYIVPLCALLLLAGSLGDRFGRKRVFVAGLIGFAMASGLCAFATTPTWLIAARAAQGVAGAILIPGSLALITAHFPVERRGRAIGTWTALSAVAMVIGPVAGGLLAGAGLWRGGFVINIPIALVTLVALTGVIESRDESAKGSPDFMGAGLAVAALALLSYALLEIPNGEASMGGRICLVASVLCLIGFFFVELISRNPLLPPRLFRSRAFLFANLITLLVYCAFHGMLVFLNLNLIQLQGFSELAAGLLQLPVIALVIVMSPFAGRMTDRGGPRVPLIIGTLVSGAGLALFTIVGGDDGSPDYWHVIAFPLVLWGGGMGMVLTPLSTTIMNSVSESQIGLASGVNSTVSRLSQVLAVAVIGAAGLSLFRHYISHHADVTVGLAPELLPTVLDEAKQFGDGIDSSSAPTIMRIAFLDTFNFIAWVTAALTWCGTVLALFIPGKQAMVSNSQHIRERTSFDFVRYANCWEDADVLCEALQPAPGKRVLSIASAGDNALALAAEGAEVIAADLNPAQLACCELRISAFRHLEYDQVLAFFGVKPSKDRLSTFAKLEQHLSDDAREYWEQNEDHIVDGFIHHGKFEEYFQTFRTRILPLVHSRRVVNEMLEEKSQDDRHGFYRSTWNTWRWRLLFRIFYSRFVMGRMGRDPEFFRYVEGSVSDRILERATYALTELPTHANPYLDYILTGNYTRALPRYLRPENFQKVREGLDRITLYPGPIEQAAREHQGDGFDAFNLSDIFEYLAPDICLNIYLTMLDVANPGARFAYWNTLVPRRRPDELARRVTTLDRVQSDLFDRDLAFFYCALHVEESN